MFFLFKCKLFFEVIKLLAKFHCLSSYQNDLYWNNSETQWPVSIPPYNYFIIILYKKKKKNESFCVVFIIIYVTVVLLFKDVSNILHVILTYILLFTLFRCCCISIIVLTRWIGWLKQQQWPKIRFIYFFVL